MKNILYSLLGLLSFAAVLSSCEADSGLAPGNDSAPAVTLYSYDAELPYNADNDVKLRFATNNKAEKVYYLAEKKADADAFIAANGEQAYAKHVVEAGQAVEGAKAETNVDVTVTGLFGEYLISAVAVSGSQQSALAQVSFTGLDWEDVIQGTYYVRESMQGIIGFAETTTTLQRCTTDDKLYRFKDVFGEGYSLKINLLSQKGQDDDGVYTFFRIPKLTLPATYSSYGNVFIQDVGYWQGDSSWVTDSGYESGMYDDYSCFICAEYGVSAGYLDYSNYDYFIPAQ